VKQSETVDQVWSTRESQRAARPHPGLVLIHSERRPRYEVITLAQPRTLGRGEIGGVDDSCLSRRHAEVAFAGGRFEVRDLGSRNGTFLDGKRVSESASAEEGLLRIGDTLFLLARDARPFESGRVELPGGGSAGATLRAAWDEIERVAEHGETLHLTGETGSGKEVAARLFHRKSPRADGPFVAVNCAAIPTGVAERLLFGAKKGAFSGADADADGYVQTAHGGTLFLDEVAELDLEVQAKLLRVLEVLPLGAAKPRHVELQVCSATHHALRDRIDAGKFREDLFFRIGRPHVRVPPLRERREDIPWLVDATLRAATPPLKPHASLVETALLRAWPGNVRELMIEVRDAARRAAARSSELAEAIDLAETAGLARGSSAAQVSEGSMATLKDHTREEIEAALRQEKGNVTRAARALGLHRNQLRRWIEANNFDVSLLASDDDD
jgi:transcriptional regulator of acetoin/glycerol metabolism